MCDYCRADPAIWDEMAGKPREALPPEECSNIYDYLYSTLDNYCRDAELLFPEIDGEADQLKSYSPRDIGALSTHAISYFWQAGLRRCAPGSPIAGLCGTSSIEWLLSFMALVKLGYTPLLLVPGKKNEELRQILLEVGANVLVSDVSVKFSQKPRIPVYQMPSLRTLATPKYFPTVDSWVYSPPKSAYIFETSKAISNSSIDDIIFTPVTQTEALAQISFHVANAAFSNEQESKAGCVVTTLPFDTPTGLAMVLAALFRKDKTCLPLASPVFRHKQVNLEKVVSKATPRFAIFTQDELQALSLKPYSLGLLSQIENVGTMSPFDADAGNKITHWGGRIFVCCEISPVGEVMSSATRCIDDEDWEFMTISSRIKDHVELKRRHVDQSTHLDNSQGSTLHECVILSTYAGDMQYLPTSIALTENQRSRTSRSFIRHPVDADRWKEV